MLAGLLQVQTRKRESLQTAAPELPALAVGPAQAPAARPRSRAGVLSIVAAAAPALGKQRAALSLRGLLSLWAWELRFALPTHFSSGPRTVLPSQFVQLFRVTSTKRVTSKLLSTTSPKVALFALLSCFLPTLTAHPCPHS